MTVLVGLKEIGAALNVTPCRVRALVAAGAPIRVVRPARRCGARGRRYIADAEALAAWVRCEKE